MNRLFVTSDQHASHANIIKYTNRPYKDIDQMNWDMVCRWNDVVEPEDTVYILGDLAFFGNHIIDKSMEFVKSINGHKILIKGNHDHMSGKFYRSLGIEEILDYKIIDGILLCHYPLIDCKYDGKRIRNKKQMLRDVYNNNDCWFVLHGHSHETQYGMDHYNVGVDLNNYTPVLMLFGGTNNV